MAQHRSQAYSELCTGRVSWAARCGAYAYKILKSHVHRWRGLMPRVRIIDISVPVETGMFRFPRPDHVIVSITEEGTYDKVKCRTSRILMGSHSGTHVDAPMHVLRNGLPVDRIALDALVGRARVLRIRATPEQSIGREAVEARLIDEPRIILDTGWHGKWATDAYYANSPKVTEGFARLLVEKGVRCLVTDVPLSLEVHSIVLGSGCCQVENVVGLDQVKSDKVYLVALPLKIKGVDGAPARVIVVEGM